MSHVCISQKVKAVLMWNLKHYFHMKTKILADFQICISVPLNEPHKDKLITSDKEYDS